MKLIKKWMCAVLCMMLLAVPLTSLSAQALEDGKVEGVRWFPIPEDKQYDDAWEVECVRDGCLCQRYNETAEDTGNANFLDTVYTANGGLTITRNGMDGMDDIYWPRIRTLSLETAPEFDLKTANTLYFDFTVANDTGWQIMLSINGMNFKLSKAISDAVGVTGLANSDIDGGSGTYKGSVNLQDTLSELAREVGTESSVNAVALQNMSRTFLPQIAIFCVGPVGASITIRELFISSAADTTGANCAFVDMGLLTGLGDELYMPEVDYQSTRPTACFSCDDFQYYVRDDGTAAINAYVGGNSDVEIPSELNGYIVTYIEHVGGPQIDYVKEIHIPITVTEIGCEAFYGYSSLVDVYYDGTQEQFNAVVIDSGNSPLLSARMHYVEPTTTTAEPTAITTTTTTTTATTATTTTATTTTTTTATTATTTITTTIVTTTSTVTTTVVTTTAAQAADASKGDTWLIVLIVLVVVLVIVCSAQMVLLCKWKQQQK